MADDIEPLASAEEVDELLTAIGRRPAVGDDIVTRLQQLLDGPVPMTVTREDVRDVLAEINRLRAAGDEVTRVLVETPCECQAKCRCGRDSAIHEWNEARRG